MKATTVLGLMIALLMVAGAGYWLTKTKSDSTPDSPPTVRSISSALTPTAPLPPLTAAEGSPQIPSDPVATVAFEDQATRESAQFQGLPRVSLRGRVVDLEGRPLQAVPVRARYGSESPFDPGSAQTRHTDERGRFEFAAVPVGARVTVRARPPSHCDISVIHSVERREPVDLGDLVAAPGALVSGLVMGPDKKPLPGAIVRATAQPKPGSPEGGLMILPSPSRSSETRTATTDAEGNFRLAGLAAGIYRVIADHAEYQADVRPGLSVSPRVELSGQNFVLSEAVTVKGRVLGPEGAPIGGADVSCRAEGMDFLSTPDEIATHTAQSSADGAFELRGLRKGGLRITARAIGFARSEPVDVKPGQECVITLAPPATVFGRFTLPAGVEAGDVTVIRACEGEGLAAFARPIGKSLVGAAAAQALKVADVPGLFAITELPDTDLRIEIHAPGCAPYRSEPVTVVAGQRVELAPCLERELALEGRVLDPAGKPIADAMVAARVFEVQVERPSSSLAAPGGRAVRGRGLAFSPDEERSAPPQKLAVTDTEGRFRVLGLGVGAFTLTATHPRHLSTTSPAVTLARGGEPQPITLTMPTAGAIAGKAWDRHGKLMALHPVQVSSTEDRGVHVFSRPKQATTDREGRFFIGGLAPGRYEAKLGGPSSQDQAAVAFAFHFETDDDSPPPIPKGVVVEAGRTTEVELKEPIPGSLAGIVIEGGAPAKDVDVRVQKKREGPAHFMGLGGTPVLRTDVHGAFAIDDLEEGEYVVSARAPGAPLPIEDIVRVTAGGRAEIRIELPTGAIEGRLIERDTKRPIPNGRIQISRQTEKEGERIISESVIFVAGTGDPGSVDTSVSLGPPGAKPILTDAEGRFRIPFLTAGAYELEVQAKKFGRINSPRIEVRDRETKSAGDLELAPSAELRVILINPPEQAGTVMALLRREGQVEPLDAKSVGKSSEVAFDGLTPGNYTLELHDVDRDVRSSTPVSISEGTPAELRLPFP